MILSLRDKIMIDFIIMRIDRIMIVNNRNFVMEGSKPHVFGIKTKTFKDSKSKQVNL